MDKCGYGYDPVEGFCERDNEQFDFKTAGDILAEKKNVTFSGNKWRIVETLCMQWKRTRRNPLYQF